MKLRSITAGALVCATALALPAGASAGSFETAVTEVKKHTSRADAALERARALYEAGRDREAGRSYAKSRRELAAAKRDAARLRRAADTARERAAAARAYALVAERLDDNVEELIALLGETEGRVENAIAKAALADTRGREKAIAVITAIMGSGVPAASADGLTEALAELSADRAEEVGAEAKALASDAVSRRSKATVATTVEEALDGQAVAAARLAALIADPDMPAASKPGLQRAYDALVVELRRSTALLMEFSDEMPAAVRTFVIAIVTQALTDAQAMEENRPSPPTGGAPEERAPDGTPTGSPEGTPPEGTPSGPPGA